MTEQDRARQVRRRHMHERQAVVFGVLLAGLAVAGVGSAALYTESISLPFLQRGFSGTATPTSTVAPVYCPPEGALPVAADQVQVNVLNGADRAGLAASTANLLRQRGFAVLSEANGPATTGVARIVYGANGVAAAYTLQAHLPDAQLTFTARPDAVIDVILGAGFSELVPAEQVQLDPAAPLAGPEGCVPYAELAAAQPAEQPAAEQPATEG